MQLSCEFGLWRDHVLQINDISAGSGENEYSVDEVLLEANDPLGDIRLNLTTPGAKQLREQLKV